MGDYFQVSENAIKKGTIALTQDVTGVAEVKNVSYIEEAGGISLKLSVILSLGTNIPACAVQIQKHVSTQLNTLFEVEVREVNISIVSLV